MATPIPEEDTLAGLEERIRRTVELVNTLRAERDAAVAALADAKRLRTENDELLSERKQVRTRIQKLLGQMDQLGGT